MRQLPNSGNSGNGREHPHKPFTYVALRGSYLFTSHKPQREHTGTLMVCRPAAALLNTAKSARKKNARPAAPAGLAVAGTQTAKSPHAAG